MITIYIRNDSVDAHENKNLWLFDKPIFMLLESFTEPQTTVLSENNTTIHVNLMTILKH